MKNRIKSYFLVTLSVLIAIIAVVMPVSSYAVEISVNGGELEAKLEEAAELQVIANAMKWCSGRIKTSSSNNVPVLSSKDVKAGKIFYSNIEAFGKVIDDTDIATGMWLEDKVQGNGGDNGTIWCTNNDGEIIKLFARAVGVDYMQGIVCQKNDDGWRGGIFKAFSSSGGGETEYDCLNAGSYQKRSGDEIKGYLKKLYNAYRTSSGNEYMVDWDKLGDFTGERGRAVGYWLYYNDFNTFCMAARDKETKIKTVSRDYDSGTWGSIKNESVKVRSNWESKKFTNFVGDDSFTCGTLKERMSNYADDYATALINYLAPRCKTALSPVISNKLTEYQAVLDNGSNEEGEEYTEESLQAAQAYVDKWKDYNTAPDMDFVEKTEAGGYMCNTEAEVSVSFSVRQPTTGGTGTGVDPTCGNSGGAGSLGWIVCPILDWMGNAAGETYKDYLEPSLRVDPTLFDETKNAGTKQGWTIFQGIANGLFIIMLLVVIFSQLTGVGIDNYGIKKILPKLIIAAVLVNVSYYICVICVDLSNILGNGLQSLFEGLPTNVSAKVLTEVGQGSAAGSTLLSVGLLSAMTVGAAWVVWTNPAILLSLLVGALGVLISILFLFILLAGREAAVVVLTVISPLAFVCYMLPNTKNLFSKWVKLGQGLLLVYPIAGLLVGGGNYVSKLLMSNGVASEGFVPALTAMLVGIIPIFFIPTVLKSSFAALGSLGAKISGVGDRLRHGATSGIRNSDRYKNAQERGIERKTRIQAGYDKNGNKASLNRFQRFMRGGRRNIQRNSMRYQKMVSDRGSLEATEGEDFMLQTETANEMKRLVASGEINNTATLGLGLERALTSGNRAQIRAYTDALTAKGEDGRKTVKSSYDSAIGTGRVSAASARTFADNIMANHAADYKNNNRSMFAVAQGINTGALATAPTVSGYMGSVANQASLANKVTSTTIGNMDDDAFDEVFGGYARSATSTIPAGAAAVEIGAAAYAALNDQNANIKAERRRHLQEIVAASGYTPAVQNVNVANPVLDVQGTVNVGNEVDVNIRQSRGGQVQPVDVRDVRRGRRR